MVSFCIGLSKVSPDFASAVKEVVDRAGWASGQDMAVITKPPAAEAWLNVRLWTTSFSLKFERFHTG